MKNIDDDLYVTRPQLPPLEAFARYLEWIWETKTVTNNGLFHQEFERKLAKYLGVKYVSLFANGTLALIIALKVLDLKGEVITTPYSFVATTHALIWNNLKPVFVDINTTDCNINPERIEEAITSETTAILPVHVYGNPCNVRAIQQIADFYGLKVIYDAAHAFGVKQHGNSILHYGDLSVLSFHGTKVFTTMEGGAIICRNEETKNRIGRFKNFGFKGETNVSCAGLNAKMNEMQSALGLLQLKETDINISKRRAIARRYRYDLSNISGIRFLEDMSGVKHNYSYLPIFVNEEEYGMSRDALYEKLKRNNIYCRRYFYPLITQFSIYQKLDPSNLYVAEETAKQVICLPIYPALERKDVDRVLKIIKK